MTRPISYTVAERLVDALYAGSPVPTGCRVNHARGVLVEGLFRPSIEAGSLSSAAAFAGPDRMVLARFSSSTGNETIAEDDPHANPRGFAVRIGSAPSLTLVGHAIEGFPARDPEEFLSFIEMLNARADAPARYERHMRDHPSARRFEALRIVMPTSFAALSFHMLHAYCLTSPGGWSVVGRLSLTGLADRADCAADCPTGSDYLERELRELLSNDAAAFALSFQPAAHDDVTDDVSVPWSDHARDVVLGHVLIRRVAPDQAAQRTIVFDPSELPSGISFAGDPMVEARIASYRIAARRRRGDRT